LQYNATTNELVDSANVAYYQLDATSKIWVPIVPDAVTKNFAESLLPYQDLTKNWFLKTKDGTVVYEWDANALVWKLLSPVSATATK
jgi:hypothetical protein